MLFPGDAVLDQLREDKETAESQVCSSSSLNIPYPLIQIIGMDRFRGFCHIHTFSVMMFSYTGP